MKIVVNNLLRLLETMAPALQMFSKNHVKAIMFLMLQFFSVCAVGQSFESYLAKAKQGDVASMSYVGFCYINGTNVTKDEKQGFEWCYKAAQKGNLDGMAMIGWCYTNGKGVAIDLKQGFEWSLKAAQGGHVSAQCNVGFDYIQGLGVSKDENKGFVWLLKSAERGYIEAQFNVGGCYDSGIGTKVDKKSAFKWYKNAALNGHSEAEYYLGLCYWEGKGVETDKKEALAWFLKSAQQGNFLAQFNVGIYYLSEQKDEHLALKWFLKSASQGYADAEFNVGAIYLEGSCIEKNEEEAVKWFFKAANKGQVKAMHSLGFCYTNGVGLDKDLTKAFRWYLKAAELGFENSQYVVASCYLQGKGVAADKEKAVEWYEKSAKAGVALAQQELASCYYLGNGMPQDYSKAIFWYNKAALQNLPEACNDLADCYMKGLGVSKNVNKAFELVDKAIDLAENNLKFKDRKGEFYSIIGDKENALELYDEIVTANPNFYEEDKTPLFQFVQRVRNFEDVDNDIPVTSTINDKTFVLVFANENYKRVESVPFAINDGEIFAKYCNRVLGIPINNVRLLKDATLNDMKYNLAWLQKTLSVFQGEGKAIVYYAGHGISDEQNTNSFLLPVDGYGSDVSTALPLGKIYRQLGDIPSKGIIVFLDACFSGSSRDGAMLISSRGVAIKVRPTSPIGNMVVFSASQNDETAYPFTEQNHGLFTYFLLKKIKDTKGDIKLVELGDFIKKQVEQQSILINGKVQSPTIVGASVNVDWKTLKLK